MNVRDFITADDYEKPYMVKVTTAIANTYINGVIPNIQIGYTTKRNGTNKASDVRSKLLDMLQLRGFEKDDIISDPDEEKDEL